MNLRLLTIAILYAATVAARSAIAQTQGDPLQRAFVEAMQQMQAGHLDKAAYLFREMLKTTSSPRVKLELARTLFLQARYKEAKALFDEVVSRTDTPWRVRDNIAHFVRVIEERTGYLKFGVTIVSDSNPRNMPAQREFSIGDLQITPTEAPKEMSGLRYSASGWMPMNAPLRAAGYLNALYADYPGQKVDRITADFGVTKDFSDGGRVRGKAGMEIGTLGGNFLYRFPYLGLDAVLRETQAHRVTGEIRAGKVKFSDFSYLDASYLKTSMSVRKTLSENSVASISGMVERSQTKERPYSYFGWELAPGIDLFWPASTFLAGARISLGARRYSATDPFFGLQRSDIWRRLDMSVSNKRWRWGHSYVSIKASFERSRSNIDFYSYHKSNVSVVVE